MPLDDLTRHGEHVMTVCNACRYCEKYCPVFQAMENRLSFASGDLAYLANLCHNCGECLYACQYAPPHEFHIDVPRTLAATRLQSYEAYAWPAWAGSAFRRWTVGAALTLAAAACCAVLVLMQWSGGAGAARGADFYAVLPHDAMVGLFGGVGAFVAAALGVGLVRFWRHAATLPLAENGATAWWGAVRDALTLRHLHGAEADCTSAEETRTPWRRWFHHCTFYGFGLCFASTTVAAVYHVALGWRAPYAYTSLPVVLGAVGGLGLLVGPLGLWLVRRGRDEALGDPTQQGLDVSFIALLFLTSLTGLLLLALRETPTMRALLVVHLGVVLALFLTLPYGKFVHGLYRVAALVRYAREGVAGIAGE